MGEGEGEVGEGDEGGEGRVNKREGRSEQVRERADVSYFPPREAKVIRVIAKRYCDHLTNIL